MDDQGRRAVFDAGQLVLQELDDQLRAAQQESSLLPGSDSLLDGEDSARGSRIEELRRVKQDLNYAIERLYLNAGIDIHRSFICRPAVERLNDDVLREIFLCADSAYNHHDFDAFPAFPIAFNVACVSRRWRSAATSFANIWTKVRLCFHESVYETLPERVETILSRSGACGLDLVLFSAPGQNSNDLTHRVMDALARLFERSRAIRISWFCDTIRFNGSILPLLLCDMPVLREFRVVQHPDGPAAFELRGSLAGLTLMTLTPRLCVLELGHLPIQLLSLPAIPLLEVFSIRSMITSDDLLTMQRSWPGLKRLQLHTVHSSGSWESEVVFAGLDTVACVGSGPTLFAVLSRTNVPRLHTVFLNCDSIGVFDACTNFLKPAPFRFLRRLTITGLCAHLIDRWLSFLPDLVELTLIKVLEPGMQTLFRGWARSIAHLPRLDQLKVVDCAFGAPVVQCFIALITIRGEFVTGPPVRGLIVLEGGWGFAKSHAFPRWLVPRVEQLLDELTIGVSGIQEAVSQYSWI